MERTTVFVSYSHSDRVWLDRLRVQLKPFEREGRIELWDDTKIKAGSSWRDEIKEAMQSARVAVLLVSADFLASEFIAENELPPLLRAAREDGATVLPVILSPCLYEEIEHLKDFQAVNDPQKPLVDLKRGAREQVFLNVARAVKDSLDERQADRPKQTAAPSPPRSTPESASATPKAVRRPTPWPGTMRHPVPEGLQLWGQVDEQTLRRIRPLEVMASTGHSVLQKCALDDEMCVLKGTRAELCDIEALRQLVTGGPRHLPSGATSDFDAMGTPRAVWINDDHVWELQHYYEGYALADIVQRERKPMTGRALLAVVEGIAEVCEVLHSRGLVHRDINPANILVLDGSAALRVVDWSFCCRQSANQVAVATPGYTAPEQESGRAACASDWYSLGATVFALANGFTLDERGPAAFARGLKQIQLGTTEFRGWDVEEYFSGLLKRDSLARPKPWESKRELFNIRRNSGAVRHSLPAAQRATPGAALAWLGRVIRSIGGR